jgi:hypothetical protein
LDEVDTMNGEHNGIDIFIQVMDIHAVSAPRIVDENQAVLQVWQVSSSQTIGSSFATWTITEIIRSLFFVLNQVKNM